MNTSSLERRIAVLERPQSIGGIDPLVLAMETLDDAEMGTLQEYMSLIKTGFPPDEIESMMEQDSYQAALDAVEKADQEYRRLTEPLARPKRRGKPLELPEEHQYDESGLLGACDACLS